MRVILTLFFSLLLLPNSFAQLSDAVKTQKTLFTISAVDDKTSAELPATYTIQALQANKKWEGKSARAVPPFRSP